MGEETQTASYVKPIVPWGFSKDFVHDKMLWRLCACVKCFQGKVLKSALCITQQQKAAIARTNPIAMLPREVSRVDDHKVRMILFL